MNITILSLISSSIFSNSPAFVSNQMFINGCNFQKITSLLFLNQQKLYLKSSSFSQSLGGIVLNDYETNVEGKHITVSNEIFDQKYQPQVNTDVSLTINNCIFTNVQENAISIENNKISVYITSCTISSCTTNQGIIFLKRTRCLTLTHTCGFDSYSTGQCAFLYYDCIQEDFTMCLYNTITVTKATSSDGTYNVICKSGNQYYRCNNMTTCQSEGYQFDAPVCFSFSMMTVVDCDSSCISLTGYNSNQCSIAYDKTIENVNLFTNSLNNKPIITIAGACDYSVTIKDSVLLSQHNLLVSFRENGKVNLTIINCVVNRNYNSNEATFINPKEADYNSDQIVLYPHYTNDVCKGPKHDKPISALDCNAGNCIDSICNRTIGFPDGVIPYTTINHLDINKPTPTPTVTFSASSQFTQSSHFSASNLFSGSSSFSNTVAVDGGNLGGGKSKGIDGKKIGIIAGVVAAVVAVGIILAAFFIIRKRKMMPTSDLNMFGTDDSKITQDNDLEKVMKDDDPFKEDF